MAKKKNKAKMKKNINNIAAAEALVNPIVYDSPPPPVPPNTAEKEIKMDKGIKKKKKNIVAEAVAKLVSDSLPPPPPPSVPPKTTIIDDSTPDFIKDAYDIAVAAFEKQKNDQNVAEELKDEFDKKYGPTWQCIVGQNFSSCVSYESENYVNFYLNERGVLLFKSGLD